MRVVSMSEWIVSLVKAMYENVKSKIRINNEYSDEFPVKIGAKINNTSVSVLAAVRFFFGDTVGLCDLQCLFTL